MLMETRQNNVQFEKPTFLPMLCSRPLIKNVTLPTKSNREDQKADPLSPKISCIGQVKRSNKIFSGKNLTFSAPTTITIKTSRGRIKKEEIDSKKIALIDVAELDPPLPVVKKKHDGAHGDKPSESLWKRRSGGGGVCQLPSLEIQLDGAHQLKVTTV